MRQPDDIDDMPDSLGPCSTHGRMNCLECYDLDIDDVETPDCHGNGGPECNCSRCLAADEKGEQMGAEARGK